MKSIIAVVVIVSIINWIRWKVCSAVLAAWISENNYAPPERDDITRLIKWVVRKRIQDFIGH
nr:MAG TPA: hypothetical protein [Caudoviricetes sp.]